jgi:predicted O-methyltransferase YrrM
MSSLNEFLITNNIRVSEGNTGSNELQQNEIIEILRNNKDILTIMEIGFNAGHSAEIFLSNSNAQVYSFDIGDHFHQYLKYGKMYINDKYPDRHTLIFGDSKETIPRFKKNNSNITFDVIFIDGGHDYQTAFMDLLNCKQVAHNKTIVIMDDIIKNKDYVAEYTIGPSTAWDDAIKKNILKEISHSDYSHGRGQSVGEYILN